MSCMSVVPSFSPSIWGIRHRLGVSILAPAMLQALGRQHAYHAKGVEVGWAAQSLSRHLDRVASQMLVPELHGAAPQVQSHMRKVMTAVGQ